MNQSYLWRSFKRRFKKLTKQSPVYALTCIGATGTLYDPSIPGNVFVQVQYAGGYGSPISVRGPVGTTVTLNPGQLVELQPTSDNRLAIVNFNVSAAAVAGVNPLASNQPQLQSGSFIGQQSIATALVTPQQTPNLTVAIKSWAIIDSTETYYEFTGTDGSGLDLSGSVPSASNNLYAVVFINADFSTVSVAVSTARSTADIPLNSADIQEALTAGFGANPGATALATIRLYGGQTQIVNADIVQDLRQMNNLQTTGGSGGGIALSAGGNTSGTLTLISSGTAFLAGGNNVTLSQSGQSITISAANQSQQTQNIIRDVSLSGNTSGTLTAITSGTLFLAGGNNVTLSQNGQSVTISAAAQSAQTGSIIREVSLSGNTSGTLTDITSGTLYLAGGNNVTLSQNGQSVTISAAAQSQQSQNIIREISLSGNTSGTLTDITSGTAYLAGGNNITLSQNGQSVTISAANQSQQTQNIIREISLSGNTSGTLTDITSGTAYLAGGNNVTLSQSGNSITISAANQSVQTQHVHDITLAGNTSGTLTIVSSGTLTLAGGNNITLSQSGNAITISGAAQSQQSQNIIRDVSLSGNTSGTLTDITSGTLYLAGGSNITLSQNGNSVTIFGPTPATLSSYQPYPIIATNTLALAINNATSGSVLLYPFNVLGPVAARHMNILVSINTRASSGSFTETMNWALYTLGSVSSLGSLSLYTSGSLSFGMRGDAGFANLSVFEPFQTLDTGYNYQTANFAGNSAGLSVFTGLKILQLLMLTTLTQGNYWLGLQEVVSTSGNNNSWQLSYIGMSSTLSNLAPWGHLSTAYTNAAIANSGGVWPQFAGSYSAAGLNTLPNNIQGNQITINGTFTPYMSFQTTRNV